MITIIEFIQSVYFFIFDVLLFIRKIDKYRSRPQITDENNSVDKEKEYVNTIKTKFEKIVENKSNHPCDTNVDRIFYDKKEFIEYMKQENNSIEKSWKTRILIEKYPKGNIIMFYDAYKLGFSYYCDQTIVPYDTLNHIAMKYVMTYQCLPFFVDEKSLPENYENPLKIHYIEEKKEKRGVEVNHNFAKLRNYNNEEQTIQKTTSENRLRNKFVYLGNIRNFKLCQTLPKKNSLNHFNSVLLHGLAKDNQAQKECMSYSDFKKKFQSVNSKI
jgi:hypothetical protein